MEPAPHGSEARVAYPSGESAEDTVGQRRSPLDVAELELLAAAGWRGTETERLGDWLLRAGGNGFSSRAHSALAVGDPGVPLPDAVVAVSAWYAERGLRPVVQLAGRQARAADAALARAGWDAPDSSTVVLTTPLEDQVPAARHTVELTPVPDADWLAAARRAGETVPPEALAVLGNADRPVFAAIWSAEGRVVGCARGVLVADWLGVSTLGVEESARRGGLATSLTRALQSWAVDAGARWCFLQALADNTPARALYRRLGFIEHHRYSYRRAPLPARRPGD